MTPTARDVMMVWMALGCAPAVTSAGCGGTPRGELRVPEPVVATADRPLVVVWYGQAVADTAVTASVCDGSARAKMVGGKLVLSNASELWLGVPWNRLAAVRAAATVGSRGAVRHRVAACSDGWDNDGDGLADQVDPGCTSLADDDEGHTPAASTNIAFDFDTDGPGVYIKSLSWKGTPVIVDPGTARGNRFFLHSDSGTHGKWTSGIQTFEQPLKNDPYQQPPFPWEANTTTWKNETSPTRTFETADINSTIVSQNATVVIVQSVTDAATIVDTFRFGEDTIMATTSVTSHIPPTNCSNGSAVVYFGTHLGNLQLGTTTGCKCPAVLQSGTGSADGHGQANNCSAACTSGLFSPATALGDAHTFTVGVQVLNPEINPDNTFTYKIEYYDIPAAPTKPLLSQYISAKLGPNETHTFNWVVRFGPAGKWADPFAAVSTVLQPYADFFSTTFGAKPAYCPQGAIGMAFRGNGPTFNRTTHKYSPGSDLYNDVLGIDSYINTMGPAGIDTAMIWQGQIYSSLLMEHGSYEFNPNSDVLDPNVNEVCDKEWTNVTKALHSRKLKLGWFGRPCSHILQADGKTAATVTCPAKKVEMGIPVPCNLQNLSDPCTKTSMATVDALIAKGVQNFYWDSYLCAGRMTFSQAVTKKYPHAFIMGEQGIDVDSVLTGGLPWMGMQAGVWDPAFEPFNSVLQRIVNPLGTAIVGAFGADGNTNHTMFSLQASKTNSLMLLIPNDLQTINIALPPNGKVPTDQAIQKRAELCAQLKVSSANAQWRWTQYGKAAGCQQPPQLDPKFCADLPPVGFVCQPPTTSKPAMCIRGWPSTATNATCSAACKSSLSACNITTGMCHPCTKGQPKCVYNCGDTCKKSLPSMT